MNLIDSQGFRSFINGTISIPPKNILITLPDRSLQEVENPDHIAWQKSDNLLKGWITGTLRKEVCCYAVGLHTSYEEVCCTTIGGKGISPSRSGCKQISEIAFLILKHI